MSRVEEYKQYHFNSVKIGDVDPSYPMLQYICNRFELNIEQRFWLAFLYACTYCGASVYYIYNEFPDYENVDIKRLSNWWNKNKEKVIFQTDRKWIKLNNQFVETYEGYKKIVGSNQSNFFLKLKKGTPEQTYINCFKTFKNIPNFGRFALFLYLEAVYVVTGFKMQPDILDLKNSESSRNGLCYALGIDNWITGKETGLKSIPVEAFNLLQNDLFLLIKEMKKEQPLLRTDIWNVETTLCAYKKYKRGQRYVGYYIDRQLKEIIKMRNSVEEGVDWSVLYDFRQEFFKSSLLKELINKG